MTSPEFCVLFEVNNDKYGLGAMAGVSEGPKTGSAPARKSMASWAFDRRHRRGEGPAEPRAALPPELGFIAGQGLSPQSLMSAVKAAPLGVRPLDALLNEGILHEELFFPRNAQVFRDFWSQPGNVVQGFCPGRRTGALRRF
jgi:hypothetical protein